ncbi:MAG: hypothetical protein Q9211_003500, partial [Gyalolechia sp. 1 TL-2023]
MPLSEAYLTLHSQQAPLTTSSRRSPLPSFPYVTVRFAGFEHLNGRMHSSRLSNTIGVAQPSESSLVEARLEKRLPTSVATLPRQGHSVAQEGQARRRPDNLVLSQTIHTEPSDTLPVGLSFTHSDPKKRIESEKNRFRGDGRPTASRALLVRRPDYNPDLSIDASVSNPNFTSLPFGPHGNNPVGPDVHYSLPASFLDHSLQAPPYQQQQILPRNNFGDLDRKSTYQQGNPTSALHRGSSPSHPGLSQSSQHFNPEILDSSSGNPFVGFDQHHSFNSKQGQNLDNTFLLDPQLHMQAQHQSINPAEIMSNMSSPPSLMPPDQTSSSNHGSPQLNQGHFTSPNHSRHASSSLGPSAALNQIQSHGDWTGFTGEQFQTHRRAPSEHSDFSSVAPSPLLAQHDSFETFDQMSPMLNPQQDNPMYQDELGIGQFSISDPKQQHQDPRFSPGHSPYVSPRTTPHPGFGFPQDHFNLSPDMQSNFNGRPGPDVYPNPSESSFPQFQRQLSPGDMGQAAQMTPPEISVDLAPPSMPSNLEPLRPDNDLDALSPPARGRRGRAKSDTSISRPMSSNPNFAMSPPEYGQRQRSLSPFDTHPQPSVSPETSPASKSRRSSTSSIPNRDYILELADPSRPSATGGKDNRVQKHPATFQCTLCPKRFTRAYNLRSHLRTHTDERPFVCTVCGKAFARQHDRKRHEGLHSGEKKFVCKGELSMGGTWGCGRRFARADALGRHFRSEAGRICIKPLLDEEALERQRVYDEQMAANNHQNGGVHPMPQPMMNGGFALPAALLAQYPALQGLQLEQLAGPGPGDEGEISGRSSFDASSGAESGYYEDEGVEGGYVSGPGTGFATAQGWVGDAGHEWASDYEGRSIHNDECPFHTILSVRSSQLPVTQHSMATANVMSSQNDPVMPKSHVGFDSITNQIERKLLKRGFQFNVICVGCFTWYAAPPQKAVHWLMLGIVIEENGVRLRLNIVDTPGYGDQVNNDRCWDPIVKYIKDQHSAYLRKELTAQRERYIQDTRVHCCLFFIQPSGHALKPIDIVVLKKLTDVVNVVPVIAKSDSLTLEERLAFKERIKEEFAFHNLRMYPYDNDEQDEEERALNSHIKDLIPFAVVGSENSIVVNGRQVRGRQNRWGVINVEDENHC